MYLLGALSQIDAARAKAHLASCTECAGDASRHVRAVSALAHFVSPAEAPSHVRERLLDSIRWLSEGVCPVL